ncbi:class I SAM-dependent methyltransferase [Enterococcus massiliensis]|uniref:class I SAM-dependent methyltransferase n=1 Tax=Enterococcus massiliensis TaxID=1640685 RepID=UPI00065E7CF3|nr:methyltransferase domain-containing protein [Enterococcus massiliensis]
MESLPDLEEIREFWDQFASEYTTIQQESALPIAEDMYHYLINTGVFPTNSFLDLAGGSGRYVTTFLPSVTTYTLVDISPKMLNYARQQTPAENLRLVCSDQAAFFAETPESSFSVVFSAMNPALLQVEDLLEMNRITAKWCLILRMTRSEDCFTSIENSGMAEESLMKSYEEMLQQQKISYSKQSFQYQDEESISRDFFREYFQDQLSFQELKSHEERFFGDSDEMSNQRIHEFQLLLWKKPAIDA